jgi:hypothetical protein
MENNEKKYLDFFGKELKVGDKVVYSNAAKDRTLRIGTIFMNEKHIIDWGRYNPANYRNEPIYGTMLSVRGQNGHIFPIYKFLKRYNRNISGGKCSLIKIEE